MRSGKKSSRMAARMRGKYYEVWYCGHCGFGLMSCEREKYCLNCCRRQDTFATREVIENGGRNLGAKSPEDERDDRPKTFNVGKHSVEDAVPEILNIESKDDGQDAHSISSLDTASVPESFLSLDTAFTSQTEVYAAASVEIVKAFFEDATLKEIFEAMERSQNFFQVSLENEARAVIETFALKLEEEATDQTENFAAKIVLKRPKTIARKISMYTFLRDTCSENSRLKLELAGPDLNKQHLVGRYLLDQSKRQNSEEHPPVRAQHEQLDLEEDELPDEEIEIKELGRIVDFIMSSNAINHLRIGLADCIYERPKDNLSIGHIKKSMKRRSLSSVNAAKQKLGTYMVCELQDLFEDQVEFRTTDSKTMIDFFKASLESFSGEPWDWWPLDPPRKFLPKHLVRMQWRCRCGELRSLDLIPSLAETCKELLKKRPASETLGEAREACGGIIQSVQGVFRSILALLSKSFTSQKAPKQQCQNSNACAFDDSVLASAQGNGNLTITLNRWILVCSFLGHRIRPSQIGVTKAMDDDAFFEALRREVRALRGFWRSNIHPKQFHSCSFSKYTRVSSNWLVKYDRQELPECSSYEYAPRSAKLDPLNPTICAHEWYTRFYNCKPTEGFCRVIERIPKRDGRFEFQMHDKEEDMWGLHVELRTSAAVVLAWLLFISVGGLGFFVWWMRRHDGDWQNAAVPLSVTMMALSSLLVPLNEHFNRPF